MRWSYKTIHFELKKEGLLGGAFLDETEIEEQLNQFGQSGWELISVIEVQNGIICFFRQPLTRGSSIFAGEPGEDAAEADRREAYPYQAERLEPYREDVMTEPEMFDAGGPADEYDGLEEPDIRDEEVYQDTDYDSEEIFEAEPYENEIVEEYREEPDNGDENSIDKRVGAIRIE